MKKLLILTFALLLSLTFISAQAQCVSYGSVTWNLQDSYGVNKEIKFKPKIISNQDLYGKSVKIELLQKALFSNDFTTIDQKTGLNVLSDNSIPEVTFFGVNTFGTIKFRLTIIDETSFESSEIQIENSLNIMISVSPQIQNTGNEIIIPISIKGEGGEVVESPIVTATIQYGLNKIQPTLVTSSQIKFLTSQIGYFMVTVSAEANGYSKDTESATFQLISANAVPKIKVGNQDYDSLDQGRISTGTKQISVGVEVGGSPVKIDKIDLYMQRPDGGFDQLFFTPDSSKTKWTTSYNFLSEDRTYTMGGNTNLGVIGTASNFDTGKDYPINVFFATVGGDDPATPGEGMPFWVWIIIGGVVLLIIGGIVIAVKKK